MNYHTKKKEKELIKLNYTLINLDNNKLLNEVNIRIFKEERKRKK